MAPSGNGTKGPARWSLQLFGDFQLSQRLTGEKLAVPGKRERVLLGQSRLEPRLPPVAAEAGDATLER